MENHLQAQATTLVTVNIEQLAQILHKTPAAILIDRTHPKRKHTVPPAIKNGKKLLWSLATVTAFLKEKEEKTRKDFLTLEEVADELGCALRTLQNQRAFLPFPTTTMFGRVVASRKHIADYKASLVAQAEAEFNGKRSGTEIKKGRGRPKKLPSYIHQYQV